MYNPDSESDRKVVEMALAAEKCNTVADMRRWLADRGDEYARGSHDTVRSAFQGRLQAVAGELARMIQDVPAGHRA